ncbi:nuclear transport factor 2 family protein [Pseudidiomarina taiwanensis]|uniref:Nuclear transport factor 2 family protein n=1 Tax=Pseudidiomarina taiwanensis TaxID=337250 RepID=A0A432ZFK2_9GAMM|nr:nuclear transport factor 2 family protein [Pseudidiomarina taiwanensis]RUO76738.1 nuclear transport factor 2 family protein [Pseudidiomarina taiwanensis]
MKRLLFGLVLLLSGGVAVADDHDANSVTATIDHFLWGASINDASIHDAFWADELTYTSSSGTRFGKAQLMAGMADAKVLEPPLQAWYTAEDYEVKDLADGLKVVNFTLVAHDSSGSETTRTTFLNTGVMLFRDGRWQALNWNATRTND